MLVSQVGDKGGSSKDVDGDNGKVFGKVTSMHIPVSIPMKPILTTLTKKKLQMSKFICQSFN